MKLELEDVFKANLNPTKLEILKQFGPKLGKFVSRLKLKLETWKKHELVMCWNSKLPSLMKLGFDKK